MMFSLPGALAAAGVLANAVPSGAGEGSRISWAD